MLIGLRHRFASTEQLKCGVLENTKFIGWTAAERDPLVVWVPMCALVGQRGISGSTRLSVVDGLGFCELGW